MTLSEFANIYLVPPVRIRYIKNIRDQQTRHNSQYWSCDESTNYAFGFPRSYIIYGFNFDLSTEGKEYWESIVAKIQYREQLAEERYFHDTITVRR
jgi:hypothetical protein